MCSAIYGFKMCDRIMTFTLCQARLRGYTSENHWWTSKGDATAERGVIQRNDRNVGRYREERRTWPAKRELIEQCEEPIRATRKGRDGTPRREGPCHSERGETGKRGERG
jgi:hypothetical protein